MPTKRRQPTAPKQVDSNTGLPLREAELGASVNASPKREKAAREFSLAAARLLRDDRCEDVLVLDLRGRSQVTDFFVVASGTSDRQMRSSADDVAELGAAQGLDLYRSNLTEARPNWIVLDFVDVVVHVFTPEARLFYDIEMLWGDAERLDWEHSDGEAVKRGRVRRAVAAAAEKDAAQPPTDAKPTRNRAGLSPTDVLPNRSRKKRAT